MMAIFIHEKYAFGPCAVCPKDVSDVFDKPSSANWLLSNSYLEVKNPRIIGRKGITFISDSSFHDPFGRPEKYDKESLSRSNPPLLEHGWSSHPDYFWFSPTYGDFWISVGLCTTGGAKASRVYWLHDVIHRLNIEIWTLESDARSQASRKSAPESGGTDRSLVARQFDEEILKRRNKIDFYQFAIRDDDVARLDRLPEDMFRNCREDYQADFDLGLVTCDFRPWLQQRYRELLNPPTRLFPNLVATLYQRDDSRHQIQYKRKVLARVMGDNEDFVLNEIAQRFKSLPFSVRGFWNSLFS